MNIGVYASPFRASQAAADELAAALAAPNGRTLVVAAGNSPLELYRLMSRQPSRLDRLQVFALDEYVGVPRDEARNCANLLRRSVAEAWGIPEDRYHVISSLADEALASIKEHERKLDRFGGVDVMVLGLGKNGHLGFNEPGSAADSPGRILDLTTTSIEANRLWFSEDYAPSQGVTLGMRTILAARKVLLVAFGKAKAEAVFRAVACPPDAGCPASWLQRHGDATFFLDERAASLLSPSKYERKE